jgi:peptide/nickel transport system ATP-binding protein
MPALEANREELLFEAKDVTGDYVLPGSIIHAVEGCSLELKNREVIGLVGESGCGKSTLGKLILGYDKPPLKLISGSVTVNGLNIYSMNLRERSKKVWGVKISRIPQYSMNSLNPVVKIKTIAVDYLKMKIPKISEKEIISKVKNVFEEIGLKAEVLERYPFELSGGMKQRAVIGISTILHPQVLVADEPTTALDVSTQRRLIEFMSGLVKKDIVPSMIFISHDIATLNQICDYFCVMYAGEMIEYGKREEIINDPLHPYTKLLINTVPTFDPEIKKRGLKDIPGFPPDLENPPEGCRFCERCSEAMDICSKKPSYCEVKNRRLVRCWLFNK